jgi:hypothetical protein
MALTPARLRKLIPGVVAILVLATIFVIGQSQVATAAPASVATSYKFQQLPIALPPGYNQQQMNTVRPVNPAYQHIETWISSVGASIAINDLTGHGRSDGMCIVDTRTNDVIVTYTPTAPSSDRFTPFVLDPAPLPVDDTMAPTGCTPGDYNGDGRMDLLVSYWGRTPILFLATSDASTPSPSAYQPEELVPEVSQDGGYHGPRWNTDAVSIGDFDGTGHPDIFVGNYFPDSDVLDPRGEDNVQMNSSLSSARNGGGDHVLLWTGGTAGAHPSASYELEPDAIPYSASTGWTLAVSSADLTGNGLPDLYVANDFGHDYLLYNESTPGNIRFAVTRGTRTPTTPKSFVLGNGSFKGMGVDFGDVNHTGKFDMMVSNIDVAWGLQESNFLWVNQATSGADMRRQLAAGVAPFTQEAQQYGVAWTGWTWDTKMADFLNNGKLSILQADGFVQGRTDRWNWLQEMAMTNDDLLSNPAMWPNIQPGDDVAGHETMAFYAMGPNGKYVNIGTQLGLTDQTPTRALATADTTGTGALDFAVARQWGPPAFYANESPNRGGYLDLGLYRPSSDSRPGTGMAGVGAPAYGTTVTVTLPDGSKQISQLDGGGGHSGFRSFEVHFGLGSVTSPVPVALHWRDANGNEHNETERLSPGTHSLVLTSTAQEVTTR